MVKSEKSQLMDLSLNLQSIDASLDALEHLDTNDWATLCERPHDTIVQKQDSSEFWK